MKALCVDFLGGQWKRIEATRASALASPSYYETKPSQNKSLVKHQ